MLPQSHSIIPSSVTPITALVILEVTASGVDLSQKLETPPTGCQGKCAVAQMFSVFLIHIWEEL